jgi:UDP-N-acetyl-2-amino-2-deoxyglucuronate dehydrogenase
MKNFAITGVGGYIAPRHLKAIQDTGNRLVAAADPHDAVGVLDRFAFDVRFFNEIERFDRHLEKLRRGPAEQRVDYVSICAPNHLHDAHIRMALRTGADVICEKPLVINPWNLDALQELERETGRSVKTVLQLRVHPQLMALRERLAGRSIAPPFGTPDLHHGPRTLVRRIVEGPSRPLWRHRHQYRHPFLRLPGVAVWQRPDIRSACPRRPPGGRVPVARTRRRQWFLSTDSRDLPFAPQPGVKTTFRSITVDGDEVEFSEGFADLHTRVYEQILGGAGFGIDEARPSIELTSSIRQATISGRSANAHPKVVARG